MRPKTNHVLPSAVSLFGPATAHPQLSFQKVIASFFLIAVLVSMSLGAQTITLSPPVAPPTTIIAVNGDASTGALLWNFPIWVPYLRRRSRME